MVLKKASLIASVYCSAQEYDTSSTKNDVDHCKKKARDYQNSTKFFVKHPRVESKTDGAELSVAALWWNGEREV